MLNPKSEKTNESIMDTELARTSYFHDDTELVQNTTRFSLGFTFLSLLGFVVSLSTTSTSTALTCIGDALNLTISDSFWIPTSGALTSAVFQPVCMTLASVVGRKSTLVFSTCLFVLGSILSATAHHFPSMIAGNCLRGIGVGGVITITDILITDMVPLQERGKWMSLLSVSWAVGISLGPIVGGLLAYPSTWRWLFLINVPICVPATVGALVTLRSTTRRRPLKETLPEVDLAGIVLLMTSTAAVLIPIMRAQVDQRWTDGQTLIPLCSGLILLCVFFVYETFAAKHPVIPLRIFNNRASMLTFLCTAIHSLTLWSLLFFLPIYFETIKNFTPVHTGLATLTQSLSLAFLSMFTGVAITRTGRYRWAVWVGWVLTTTGYGLLYILNPYSSLAIWIPINVIPGIGAGLLFSSMSIAIQAPVPKEHVAVAVTLHTFFRSLGSTFGIAVGGAVFQDRLRQGLETSQALEKIVESLDIKGNLLGYVNLLSAYARQDADTSAALNEVYNTSLRGIWITITAFAAGALLISFAIPSYSLVQPNISEDEHSAKTTEPQIAQF